MPHQIPKSEIITRTFFISPDKVSGGSAYAYEIDKQVYLITAAHVVKNMRLEEKNALYIFRESNWLEVESIPFLVEPYILGQSIDIAVLKTSMNSDYVPITPLSLGGAAIGQDAYFLGFPYFNTSIPPNLSKINHGFPVPFVKKGTLSSFNEKLIYLDGHNNPGFSGGPVLFWDHMTKNHKICGIISGYLNHSGEVSIINTSSIKGFYAENSGIGIAYNISYAVKLLEKLSGKTILI